MKSGPDSYIDTNGEHRPERRSRVRFSETQMDDLAERAAERAVNKVMGEFYKGVGKGVVNKVLMFVGAAVVAFVFWAQDHLGGK